MLRWNSAGGDRRRAFPPRDVQPFAAFLGHDVPVISPAELRDVGVHRGPPAGRGRSAGGRRRRSPSRSAGSWPPASASSTPTTAASTRRPTSAGFGEFYDAELRFADRARRRRARRAAAGRRAARHRRPRPGRRRRQHRRARPELLAMVAQQSGEGRFRWWHARPRRRRRPRQGGRRALRRRGLGRHPRADHRRALVRPDDRAADGRPGSATSPSSPTPRSASTTRPTPGRSRSSAATAR